MGHRGVDLAELKARRARADLERERDALVMWAQQLAAWIGSPLENDVDERLIAVPATGERFILTRRKAEP